MEEYEIPIKHIRNLKDSKIPDILNRDLIFLKKPAGFGKCFWQTTVLIPYQIFLVLIEAVSQRHSEEKYVIF